MNNYCFGYRRNCFQFIITCLTKEVFNTHVVLKDVYIKNRLKLEQPVSHKGTIIKLHVSYTSLNLNDIYLMAMRTYQGCLS